MSFTKRPCSPGFKPACTLELANADLAFISWLIVAPPVKAPFSMFFCNPNTVFKLMSSSKAVIKGSSEKILFLIYSFKSLKSALTLFSNSVFCNTSRSSNILLY